MPATPTFDPSQPYEAVGFDPSQPFELIEPKSKVFSDEEAARLDKAIAEQGMSDLGEEEFKAQVAAREKASGEPIISPETARMALELGTSGIRVPEQVQQLTEGFMQGAAEQISGMSSPTAISTLPLFSIPYVGPAVGALLGGKAVGEGAKRLSTAQTQREAGQALSEIAGGGTMVAAPVLHGIRPTVPEALLTPEQIAEAQRRAVNIAAPGTVRPQELQVMGTPEAEKPSMFELGNVPFQGALRFGAKPLPPVEVLPQMGRLPEPRIIEETRTPEELETRGKVSFGAEAPTLVRTAIDAGEQAGLTKSVEALAEQERKNASTVRSDTGQLPQAGEVPQGGEKVGGDDLQRPPSGAPVAPEPRPPEIQAFEKVKSTEDAWDYGAGNQTPEGIAAMEQIQADLNQQMADIKASDLPPNEKLNQRANLASGPLHFIKEALSAARGETDRPAMTQYLENRNKPIGQANRVAKMSPDEIAAMAKSTEGGMSRASEKLGEQVTTPEEITHLKKLQADAEKEFNDAMAKADTGDPAAIQQLSPLAAKWQFFSEAIESAVGVYKNKPNLSAEQIKATIDAGEPALGKQVEPSVEPALAEVGMGGAKPAELPARPTIEETIPARPGGTPPVIPPEAPRPSSAAGFIENVRSIFTPEGRGMLAQKAKGFLGTISGQTMPRTTVANQAAGEAGARYLSSRIAAPYIARIFSHDVRAGLNIDPVKFGAALSEDNLRSVRAANPEAGGTFSFVGEGKPFKTEAEYQAYLKDPNVQEAIKRHISNWNAVIEPMYREAQRIDPSVELPSRGEQTGARVNLAAVLEGEEVPGLPSGSPRGGLMNTLRRKSPFARQAKGTGEAYHANYDDLIANSMFRQMEIANKNVFDQSLVDQGLAVIDKPGQQIKIGGQDTVPFPLKRKVIITEGGSIPQAENIYVRRDLAREYRNAANVDENPYRDFIFTKINSAANQAALAGLTDATVHLTNLSTALAQLPVSKLGLIADSLLAAAGRLDIPVAGMRLVKKGAPQAARALLQRSKLLRETTPDVIQKSIEDAFWKNQTQLAALAEIGAAKAAHPSTGLPVMRQMSDVIQWYDRTTRMVLDDAYKDLAERGIVENSETARREFVNQVGQYNKRAQGVLVRLSRDLGTGPFVTAGRAFNVLGVRGATLSPGVKATSGANAALLRANAASKWLGTLAFVGLVNYLITGHVQGRKGTPIGSIDTGTNDEQGRMKSFSVMNLTGQGRALRVTGARGALEAAQKGLPGTVAADAAARDVANSWIAPFAGPPVKAAFTAVSGFPPAISVGRSSKVVPPGQSQTLENVKQAAVEVNPIAAGISKSMEPGKTWEEAVKTQLPRFTLQTKQPEKMIKDYPAIVRRAQSNAYIEDVIHRARYIENAAERRQYVRDALLQLDPQDRTHAELTLRFRKIDF